MAKEGLPPHLSEEVVDAKADFYHNWLYSVVPVSYSKEVWDHDSDGSSSWRLEFPLRAVLVGYCRNCGRAFSQVVETNEYGNQLLEQQMHVPKTGCVPPPGTP